MAQSVTCPEPLNFGDVLRCSSTGTVTVNPDASRTTGGCVATGGAPYSRARCIVTQGYPFDPIKVSLTSPTVILNAGTHTMTVKSFNLITNARGHTATISPGVPYLNVPVGGTLHLDANQAAGSYSGTFTLNVTLQ